MYILYNIFILIFVHQSFSLNPVLLVPGDGGSIIKAKYSESLPSSLCGASGDWFVLWLNVYYFTPFTLNCFIETIKLEYNPFNRSTFSPNFCETKVEGFGTSDSVEYFSHFKTQLTSYFYYVINSLVKHLGYVPNKSIRGAPYDFRKAPHEMSAFLKNLKYLIEQMYAENSNSSVIIMAHSMGNMYIIELLNSMHQQWKNKYIKSFLSLSAPYAGAVDAVRTALSGNNEHISILSTTDLRRAQSTWPSTYHLMPVPKMWSSNPIVITKEGNYSVNNIGKLLKSSGIQYAEEHYEDIIINRGKHVAPNVPVHCIYTDDIPTSEFLDYRKGVFPDDIPSIVYGPGDGTVNLQSLQHCTNWQNDQTEPVITHIIPGVKHLAIMRDLRLNNIIINIITDYNKIRPKL